MVIGQRVLSYVGFGDNFGIWEGSIIYEDLYLVFEAKAIVGFAAKFLVVMAISIKVPSRRYGIRHRCRI